MKFTESHEWVDLQEGVGTVGITGHAQKELGEIVYVEFPEIGKTVQAGDEVAVIESTKAAIDISSPVSGEVVEVNLALKENPDLINKSPQTEGWLFKVKVTNTEQLEKLLDQIQYLALIR